MLPSLSRPRALQFLPLLPRLHVSSEKLALSLIFAQRRWASESSVDRSSAKPISLSNFENAGYDEVNTAIQTLRKATASLDVETAWKTYNFLLDKGFKHFLTPSHYEPLSKMIVHVCRAENDKFVEMRPMLENLALACAHLNFQSGLRELLLKCLAQDDSDSVIRLYDLFVRSGPKHASKVEEEDAEEEASMDSYSVRFSTTEDGRFQIRYILTIVVAAYARKGAFHDAIALLLKNQEHRIVSSTIKLTLQGNALLERLIKPTTLYCEAASTASLASRPLAFKAHVRNLLVGPSAGKRLSELTENLLAGFNGDLPWATLKQKDVSPSRPVLVTDEIWATLIKAHISARQDEAVEKLWLDLLDLGMSPSTALWNGLLEAYRDTNQTDKLLTTWSVMKEEGVKLDSRSYIVVIAGMGTKGGMASARSVFKEFQSTLGSSEDSILVYNTVLDLYLTAGDLAGARDLFTQMKDKGPPPDIVTYNIFCKYHGRKNDLKAVSRIVHEMVDSGTQPDVFTFTTLLTTMLRMRVPNASQRLLEVMQSMGVEENVATYSAIIDALARDGSVEGIRSAWDILQSMETMAKAQPNETTYTSLLIGVHRSRDISLDLMMSITNDIVRKMRERKVRLRRGMYHVLIKVCLENPRAEALSRFKWYYSEMKRKNIALTNATWFVILRGLMKRKEWAMASESVDDMFRSGFQPNGAVLAMVKDVHRWKAR